MNTQFERLQLIQLNNQLYPLQNRIIQLKNMIDSDPDPVKMKKDFFNQQIKQLTILKKSLQLMKKDLEEKIKKDE